MIKVMVVDDEAFVRRGIVEEIDWESLGCQVVAEAGDGLEGQEKCAFFKPDLIISDIRMPKCSGIDMLREIRKDNPSVKVIFLTAYSEFEYAREALKLFAFDYLLKPFEDGELEEVVRRVRDKIEEEQGIRKENVAGREVRFLPEFSNSADWTRTTKDAVSYMEEHYGEKELSIGRIAEELQISEGHLSHLFKKDCGITVINYLLLYRMEQAAKLLQDPSQRVYEVAELVGYRDIAYFSQSFKKIAGMTPSEWRNQ